MEKLEVSRFEAREPFECGGPAQASLVFAYTSTWRGVPRFVFASLLVVLVAAVSLLSDSEISMSFLLRPFLRSAHTRAANRSTAAALPTAMPTIAPVLRPVLATGVVGGMVCTDSTVMGVAAALDMKFEAAEVVWSCVATSFERDSAVIAAGTRMVTVMTTLAAATVTTTSSALTPLRVFATDALISALAASS